MFRAFRYRNYCLYFFGQGISLVGTWTQQVALSWLVYRLTGSMLLLGTVAFCNQVPTLLFGPLAGVVADRLDRKRLLQWIQTMAMVQAFLLAALVLARIIKPWEIITLSILLGTINAFDMPTLQSFVTTLIENKDDLGNAIALSSAMFNCARLIGPAIAGVLISAFGEGICFLVNGISFLAVLASLQAIKVEKKKGPGKKGPLLGEFREAVVYAIRFEPIIAVLVLLSVFALAGAPYIVLMPAFAKDILHGDSNTYGLLMSFSGLGAVTGTFYLASRKNAHGLVNVIPAAVGTYALSLAALALLHTFAPCAVLLFIAGFSIMIHMAASNTIIQSVVDEDKRGRVTSLFAMSFMGVMPFGSFLAGSLAAKIGVRVTLIAGASLCLIGAAVFAGRLPRLGRMLDPVLSRIEPEG